MRRRPHPALLLGIDIGAARTRVALCERDPSGRVALVAVAARPTDGDAAAAIAEAWSELGTRERRCVLGLAAPDAALRAVRLPTMRRRERERAARFEAARLVSYPIAEATVRLANLGNRTSIIGIARRDALARHLAATRRAGLRPIAVDDNAFALLRAFPEAEAILDVGERATLLVAPGDPVPVATSFPIGGRTFTAALVASLGIDEMSAEQRKRTIGLAGAGEHVRDALVEQLATSLVEMRAAARSTLREITLTGNGSRLPGLAEALQRVTAIPVRLGTLLPVAASTIPGDVVRAASPDWGLAYGLALWETAG
jgi:type IV pilus assembly protein PilM